MTETRADATARVTCQAAAWLWHARGCRALATEVGLSWSSMAITTPHKGQWRIDVAGCAETEAFFTSTLVEVKGTYADLARERIADVPAVQRLGYSKWYNPDLPRHHELWIACGDIKTAYVAEADVPEHWGVILFPAEGKTTVLRKAMKHPAQGRGDAFAAACWKGMAQVQTTTRLPTWFNGRRGPEPWQRMHANGWHEERAWIRDNKQLELSFSNMTMEEVGDGKSDQEVQDRNRHRHGASRLPGRLQKAARRRR